MTKEEFLERCGNAFDMGLCTPERLTILNRWVDLVLRLEGGQMHYVIESLEAERRRAGFGKLAGDEDGYATNQLLAILTHPCQLCAASPDAWHTRVAFCDHRKPATKGG